MPIDSQQEIRKRVEENLIKLPNKQEFTELIGTTISIYDQIHRENVKRAVRPEIERHLEAEIRNRVALIFTWAFVLLFGSVLIYIIVAPLFSQEPCDESTPKQLVSILQGIFLPMLTLVLGYFFGSKISS